MKVSSTDDQPLQELKHDAVPGYMTAFLVAFALMTAYLAWILISSPGPVGHAKDGDDHGEHQTEHQESP